ncbi:MAG: hypothetical protein K8R13_05310 [Methanococcoides sp.]|jgi:hypothetical protein|nr:hypothetical protein [Desulfobacterales bacterium]MCD4806981.1 hypothetical protein [Methanococcoides sp.]
MVVESKNQLEVIMSLGKVLMDDEITKILNELQNIQPTIYDFIYGDPSDAIDRLNRDMAYLYLDLSFDVVWFFHNKFGKLPVLTNHEKWTIEKIALIDAELKSLTNEIKMDDKFRINLQERFVKRSLESSIQLQLLQYIEEQVEHYASFNKKREKAVQLTMNLLFVLVRLFGDLYSVKQQKV